MIQIIINLYLITVICVCIIDFAQFTESIKYPIRKWLRIKGDIQLKPFDCSLCSTFWAGLIYLLITGNLSIVTLAVTLLFAITTTETYTAIYTIKTIIIKFLNKINK